MSFYRSIDSYTILKYEQKINLLLKAQTNDKKLALSMPQLLPDTIVNQLHKVMFTCTSSHRTR